MKEDRHDLMRDFASGAGHLADAFEQGAPDAVDIPAAGDDALPLDIPDDLPETPDRGGDDLDFSGVADTDLGDASSGATETPAAAALADLAGALAGDDDYRPDPSREPPRPQSGEAAPPSFSQWTERDGSVVFEDGPDVQQGREQAPESEPRQGEWGQSPPASAEPESDVLGGALGDIFGLLEGIAGGIAALSGQRQQGSQQAGLNLPTSAVQLPWSGMKGGPTPEDLEGYAAASPSIMDATTLGGARGAGGHGYGSRPKSPLADFTEPGKRLTSHG